MFQRSRNGFGVMNRPSSGRARCPLTLLAGALRQMQVPRAAPGLLLQWTTWGRRRRRPEDDCFDDAMQQSRALCASVLLLVLSERLRPGRGYARIFREAQGRRRELAGLF
jgi:hypothetical protein